MTPAELGCAKRRTEQRWYELVRAEQQGASMQMLEHLYCVYMLEVEEYNRAVYEYEQREKYEKQREAYASNPPPSAIGSFFGS